MDILVVYLHAFPEIGFTFRATNINNKNIEAGADPGDDRGANCF